jgi:hypothetical protein
VRPTLSAGQAWRCWRLSTSTTPRSTSGPWGARGDTPEAVSAWGAPLKDALYTQGTPAVLAALDALVPPDAAAAKVKVVETTRAYCADNAARMDDPRFVAPQLPIGAGAVQSLGKSVSEARLKHAGMRWTPAGAPAVATLRALSLSGAWEAFWAGHPLRTRLRHCPPARPRRRPAPVPPPAVVPPATRRSSGAPALPAPPPAPAVASGTAPPRRAAATHPWRRAPIGRARCA